MPAHLCLMAWNWPIGRPNCSRILAYSDAVSVAQRATPTHSADSSVDISARARSRLRLDSTRSSPTSTALARTCASGRSGSTLLTGSISSWSASMHHPLLAALDRDRQHQQRRLRGRGHGAHLAADDEPVALAGGGQPGVDRVGGDGVAGRQPVESLVLRVVGGDQRAGDGRRDERAGHRAVAELGQRRWPVRGCRSPVRRPSSTGARPAGPARRRPSSTAAGSGSGSRAPRAARPTARRAPPATARNRPGRCARN